MARKHPNTNTVKSLLRDFLNSKSASPLSSKAGKREINAAARLRYGPLQRETEAQARASEAQTKRDKGYYHDYLDKVANLQRGTTGIYKDANAQLAQAQGAASTQDTRLLGMVGAQRAAFANQTGAPSQAAAVNPLAAAQAVRGTNALDNQARVIGQGASARSYMVDQRRIGQRAKLEQMIQGENRTASISQQLADLAREKGAFKADLLRDNRDADRGFLIDLLSGPNARKYLKLQSEESRKGAKLDAKLNPPSSSSSSGNGGHNGPGPDTDRQDQKQGNKAERQDARAYLLNDPPPPGTPYQAIFQRLTKKYDVDPSIARQVAKAWANKHSNSHTDVGGAVSGVGGIGGLWDGGGKGHKGGKKH